MTAFSDGNIFGTTPVFEILFYLQKLSVGFEEFTKREIHKKFHQAQLYQNFEIFPPLQRCHNFYCFKLGATI
jgi:hypothetical protein